jgi:hypothetical protein
MKNISYLLVLVSTTVFSQVGIGTTTPSKDLHIAGPTSTIRIESLNSVNSSTYNLGGSTLTPVFVDADGDLTLNPPSHGTSGGGTFTNLPINFLINVPNFIPDGATFNGVVLNNDTAVTNATRQLISVPFSSPQNALVEVKYGVTINLASSDLNVSPAFNFADLSARTYNVWFYIDINNDGLSPAELSKRYGDKGQAYASLNQGIVGYPYMNSQGYANIPAGNHALVFYAETNDGTNKYTSVGFGGDLDYLKIRIYN